MAAMLLACGGCLVRTGPEKLGALVRQLEGNGCAFTAEPMSGREPRQTCRPRESRVVEWLLTSPQECVRDAAYCLGEMGPAAGGAVPALVAGVRKGLNNYDSGDGIVAVRDAMVEALGRTGGPGVLPVLLEALEHPKVMDSGPGASGEASRRPVGEEAALRALGHLGAAAAPAVGRIVPHLMRQGDSPYDRRVVEAAAAALRQIGDPAAIPALTEALQREPTAHKAAEALGRFGAAAQTALPVLRRLIETAPERQGEAAIRRAIVEIGGPAAAQDLPQAYREVLSEMARMVRSHAKRRGLRLTRLHVNGPKEQIEATLPDGRELVIGISQEAWSGRRVAAGTLRVRRGGAELSRQEFAGTSQVEQWLAGAMTG